ncbi:hypothetical protein VIN01S_19700 [Vibrio inusitatus NBRC 102082]|uniref:Lysozyme inhibitor LprI-like N-terminal domain-containing protein n=1 Tax=Vibrio inusitatus NBRC 102082 TaxID=1219070 RepID=A0A4Y3HVN6_9VIBR|nr:lysozyme inhibitor LprI family protein [Vibrio inusitatus]GEA51166.1 hypothetical protein VIN01S_19700 [Vibrio inusitatus NBRC 102082]
MRLIQICFFALIGSFHCYADEFESQKAQQKALKFAHEISSKNYAKAYQLIVDNGIEWRFSGMMENREIYSEEDFLRLAPIIFKNVFIGTVDEENVELTCCLGGYSTLEGTGINDDVTFYYFDSGTPYLLINETMALPSFDCASATTDVEVSICNNYKLSNQDQKLSSVYKDAQRFFFGSEQTQLQVDQIEFLRQRNQCGSNSECIHSITEERINTLNDRLDSSFISKEPVTFTIDAHILNGTWRTSDDFDMQYASNIYPLISDDYPFLQSITFSGKAVNVRRANRPVSSDFPVTQSNDECIINSINNFWYANVYYQTAYQNNYFGRMGGDFSQLPFAVNYSVYELSYVQDRNKICGIIIITGKDNSIVLFADDYIDKPLVDQAWFLKRDREI